MEVVGGSQQNPGGWESTGEPTIPPKTPCFLFGKKNKVLWKKDPYETTGMTHNSKYRKGLRFVNLIQPNCPTFRSCHTYWIDGSEIRRTEHQLREVGC